MPPSKKNDTKRPIESYEHADKERLNNPPIGPVTPETHPDAGKKTYQHDPVLHPCSLTLHPKWTPFGTQGKVWKGQENFDCLLDGPVDNMQRFDKDVCTLGKVVAVPNGSRQLLPDMVAPLAAYARRLACWGGRCRRPMRQCG